MEKKYLYGMYYVSHKIKTNDGKLISFLYEADSALPEVSEEIVKNLGDFFEIDDDGVLWVKESANGKITLENLKTALQYDPMISMSVVESETGKNVFTGDNEFTEDPEGSWNLEDLKDLDPKEIYI